MGDGNVRVLKVQCSLLDDDLEKQNGACLDKYFVVCLWRGDFRPTKAAVGDGRWASKPTPDAR